MGGNFEEGMTVGQPFFGFTIVAGTSLAFSQLSSDYATVFYKMNLTNTFDIYNQDTACNSPTPSNDICGTWNQPCSPPFMVNTRSYDSVFMYDGPSTKVSFNILFPPLVLITTHKRTPPHFH